MRFTRAPVVVVLTLIHIIKAVVTRQALQSFWSGGCGIAILVVSFTVGSHDLPFPPPPAYFVGPLGASRTSMTALV